MRTDRLQTRHQWVSLFASLGLLDGVGTPVSIMVKVCALRAIKKADGRDKGLQTRVPPQAFENGGPRDVIVGADAINTEHGGAASRLRGQVELARQGFRSSLRRQRVLERRAHCLESLGGLLSASSRDECRCGGRLDPLGDHCAACPPRGCWGRVARPWSGPPHACAAKPAHVLPPTSFSAT